MNPAARGNLIEQLKAHTMEREYVAYVEGRPAAPRGTWRQWLQLSKDELRQQVLSPAQVKEVLKESTADYADAGKRGRGGSAGASPYRQKVDTRGGGRPGEASLLAEPHRKGGEAREAITHFEVIGEFVLAGGKGVVSKLRLRLETGRKHQIRAQAAYAGVPLVGDRTYNPRYRGRDAANPPIDFPRQALHAEVLKLEHPERPGKRMSWRAELPKDLRQLEADLRAGRI
jgi:23S rRNA-/tRNA-specific pseudouridylate synthase